MESNTVIQIIDGLGGRLNTVESTQARHDERIKDNKEAVLSNREAINGLYLLTTQIKDSINAALWKILLAVSFPTILLLIQLIIKNK